MLRRWLPPILLGVAILGMSGPWASATTTGSLAGPWLESLGLRPEAALLLHGILRKVGHVTAYALFAALVLRAARGTGPSTRTLALRALLAAVALAACDEALQSLSAERTGSPSDVVLDACGAWLSVLLSLRAARRAESAPTE